MIIYNRNLKELKNEVKEVCGVVCKVPIVVGIIFLIIAMYFLLVGFIDDKEALGYGYWCVVIFTVCLILTLRIYFYYKKGLNANFEDNNVENIEYVLDYAGNRFITYNRVSWAQTTIYDWNIKHIYYKKYNIILVLRFNAIVTVPNTEEIKNFVIAHRNNI